jgi:hypothetical protein
MTPPVPTPEELDALRRKDAHARHVAHVKDLLDRRTDLAGTIALADLVHDASTWAA